MGRTARGNTVSNAKPLHLAHETAPGMLILLLVYLNMFFHVRYLQGIVMVLTLYKN